jgi:hypothetical protein
MDHHLSLDNLAVWATLVANNLNGLLKPQAPRMRD